MSLPKETRQLMINIMYLVLTALLALNVSAEILNAFHVVNRGIVNSNNAAGNRSQLLMNDFNEQMRIQEEATRPFYLRALSAHSVVADFIKKLDEYKTSIIQQSGGWIDKNNIRHSKKEDSLLANWSPEAGKLFDDRDLEAATRIMIEEGGGEELKKLIEKTRSNLLLLIDSSRKKTFEAQLPIRIDEPLKNQEGQIKDWVNANFEMVPTIAAVTLLNKFQNDARNAEMQILDHLYGQINIEDIKVDSMQARVFAPANYIMSGEPYTAQILMAAYNSKQDPQIIIGPLNEKAVKDKQGKNYLACSENPVINGQSLEAIGGIGNYMANTSQAGIQKVTGAIMVPDSKGNKVYYPFESEYMVMSAAAVVSSDNLNVIYAGIPNPFSVSVPGFSADRVMASISGGTFTKKSNGKYDALLNGSLVGSEVRINVSVQMNDGSSRTIAQMPFKVKSLPTPLATINGRWENGGRISKGELLMAGRVGTVLRNFYFLGVKYNVTSFKCTYVDRSNTGKIVTITGTDKFDATLRGYIEDSRAGERFIFYDIVARDDANNRHELQSIPLEIK